MLEHADITEVIIGSSFEVHRIPGYGYLEKVYRNAMQHEIISRGHGVQKEYPIKVHCQGVEVGEYYADFC